MTRGLTILGQWEEAFLPPSPDLRSPLSGCSRMLQRGVTWRDGVREGREADGPKFHLPPQSPQHYFAPHAWGRQTAPGTCAGPEHPFPTGDWHNGLIPGP